MSVSICHNIISMNIEIIRNYYMEMIKQCIYQKVVHVESSKISKYSNINNEYIKECTDTMDKIRK